MTLTSILNSDSTGSLSGIELKTLLLCLLAAFVCGAIIAAAYTLSEKGRKFSGFSITLVVLPAIVAAVILMVGSDTARALSVAGTFTLVRFRSVPGDARDITSIFFGMAAGLAAGMGYLTAGLLFTIVVALIFLILYRGPFGEKKDRVRELKITIPENLNYEGTFDDLFAAYTDSVDLVRVKTTNLGALYELAYQVQLKNGTSQKEFIDKLRTRNGNLNITLGIVPIDHNKL